MSKTPPAERPLENYSKAALIAFIKNHLAFGCRDWARELDLIERELEVDRLMRDADRLIEQGKAMKFPEDSERYFALSRRLDRVWARIFQLMGVKINAGIPTNV